MTTYKQAEYSLFPVVAGLLSFVAYVYLSISSQHYGQLELWQFYLVVSFCVSLCFLVWVYHEKQNVEPTLWLVIGFAFAFRLVGVSAFPPLEDDFYRYLWDGRMSVEHGSPYGIAPATLFGSFQGSEQFEEILGLINYPDIPTIYGPVNQWVFAVSYLIAPGEVWPLQLIYTLADLLVIVLLLKLARPNMVLLYAWSPLIIKEFAFTAHPDILGVVSVVAAYFWYRKSNFQAVALLLALAVGVKIFALVIVPFLLVFRWRAWLTFLLAIIVIGLPWGFLDTWLPAGLLAMGDGWVFNSPLYLFLQHLIDPGTLKITLLSVLAIFYLAYFVRHINVEPPRAIRGDYLFGTLLLLTPVINPWYLAWLLPFAVIFPSLWAWVASAAVLLSYCTGINLADSQLGDYEVAPTVLAIEFLLITISLVLQKPIASWWNHRT